MADDLESRMKAIVGNHVLSSREDIIPFLSDASYFEGDVPYMVVIPHSTDQVSKIMALCTETSTPVVIRGGGTSLTGASILKGRGVIVSMSRLNRVIETSVEDKYVVAEPGVRLDDLNIHLEELKHFYPPDPASSRAATVGGSLSTNAGGLRAAMYGTTKNWVLGLEVVMPNGEILQFGGKTLKRTSGFDLTSLMVGSEGTLGVITKAILKIWPVPEKRGRAAAHYSSIESIGKAVSEIKKRGITPMIAEFMDELTLNSITRNRGLKFPSGSKYMLIMDVATTRESVDRELGEVAEILGRFDPIEVTTTTDEKEMEVMYEARKGAYASLLTERESPSQRVVIGDIVVPASKLTVTLKEIQDKMDELEIKSALIGHIGDGNIHANIYANLDVADEMERVDEFMRQFGAIAIRHEGSVSAEHGIGQEKIGLLEDELRAKNSLGSLELMKKIKAVFDPSGILNREKLMK